MIGHEGPFGAQPYQQLKQLVTSTGVPQHGDAGLCDSAIGIKSSVLVIMGWLGFEQSEPPGKRQLTPNAVYSAGKLHQVRHQSSVVSECRATCVGDNHLSVLEGPVSMHIAPPPTPANASLLTCTERDWFARSVRRNGAPERLSLVFLLTPKSLAQHRVAGRNDAGESTPRASHEPIGAQPFVT